MLETLNGCAVLNLEHRKTFDGVKVSYNIPIFSKFIFIEKKIKYRKIN